MSALDIGARGLAARALAAADRLSQTPEDFGAAGDGVFNTATGEYDGTDDTAAIMACFDALQANGVGGSIYFDPAKVYVCSSSTSRVGGSLTRTLELYGDNIRLYGGGMIAFKGSHGANWRCFLVGGAGKIAGGTGDITTQRCVDKAGYAITGALAAGAITIPVAAGEEANFAPGDIAFIRSGQLVNSSTTEPNAELAVVASVASGAITLTKPLSKPYEQEYFISGTTGKTSSTVTANAARYEIVNVTDRVQRNLRIEGLRLFNKSGGLQLLSTWGVLDATFALELVQYPYLGWGQRDCSVMKVDALLCHNGATNTGYGFHPSSGCTRYRGRVDQASPGFNSMNLHEGVADVQMSLRSRNFGNVGEVAAALNVGARAYNLTLDADIDAGASSQGAFRALESTVSNVRINWLRCKGNVRDDTALIKFGGVAPEGTLKHRGFQIATRSKGSPLAAGLLGFTGIVTYNKGLDLGQLPINAVPYRVHVETQVAFNGTSNRINIGWSGLATALGNAVIVGTVGSQELVAGGATTGPSFGRQRTTAENIIADWAGSGTPTAGRALVTVFYYIGAAND